jgi:hypothetical protein
MSLTERPLQQLSLPVPGPPFHSHGPTRTRLTVQTSQSVRTLLQNLGWPPPWGPDPWLLGDLQAVGVMVEEG